MKMRKTSHPAGWTKKGFFEIGYLKGEKGPKRGFQSFSSFFRKPEKI